MCFAVTSTLITFIDSNIRKSSSFCSLFDLSKHFANHVNTIYDIEYNTSSIESNRQHKYFLVIENNLILRMIYVSKLFECHVFK